MALMFASYEQDSEASTQGIYSNSAIPRLATPSERSWLSHGSQLPGSSVSRLKHLIWYQPSGSDQSSAIGAVWSDDTHLHWATPLQRRLEGIFNPLPFMLRFPAAQYDWAHFRAALDWFDSMCFAASDSEQVRAACEREPAWGLRCFPYPGSHQGADLAVLLCPAPDWDEVSVDAIHVAVLASVAKLVRQHRALQGMCLQPVHDGTVEVGRLDVAGAYRVRLLVHSNANRASTTTLAQWANEFLRENGVPGDRLLLVLPHLSLAEPLYPAQHVAIVDLDFGVLARALVALSLP